MASSLNFNGLPPAQHYPHASVLHPQQPFVSAGTSAVANGFATGTYASLPQATATPAYTSMFPSKSYGQAIPLYDLSQRHQFGLIQTDGKNDQCTGELVVGKPPVDVICAEGQAGSINAINPNLEEVAREKDQLIACASVFVDAPVGMEKYHTNVLERLAREEKNVETETKKLCALMIAYAKRMQSSLSTIAAIKAVLPNLYAMLKTARGAKSRKVDEKNEKIAKEIEAKAAKNEEKVLKLREKAALLRSGSKRKPDIDLTRDSMDEGGVSFASGSSGGSGSGSGNRQRRSGCQSDGDDAPDSDDDDPDYVAAPKKKARFDEEPSDSESVEEIIPSALPIGDKWIDLIKRGKKSIELRSTSLNPDRIGIYIPIYCPEMKAIVGLCMFSESYEIQTAELFNSLRKSHCYDGSFEGTDWHYAWVLKEYVPLDSPVPSKPKQGAIGWHILSESVMTKIRRQMK